MANKKKTTLARLKRREAKNDEQYRSNFLKKLEKLKIKTGRVR